MFKFISKAIGICGYIIQYGCLTHCTFEYIGDFVFCSGPSMEPTLYSNNILITERISAQFNRIRRGDIIIAKSITNPSQHVCKRVIGLPGDRIFVQSSTVNLNPFSNKSNFSTTTTSSNGVEENNTKDILTEVKTKINQFTSKEIIVPRGHVWIEGDNSENSSDSRCYGSIPQGLIRSRAVLRIFPLTDMKLLI